MPSSKSCRKCRDAAVGAVGMVIPEHQFDPADQIHHVQQDRFRLSRDLRPTLRSGWEDTLSSVEIKSF